MIAVEFVSYVGTLALVESDPIDRARQVRDLLRDFQQKKDSLHGTPVLVVVSLEGIKVCSPNGKTVYMAHALRRISYATCDATQRQFAFVAREPGDTSNSSYCHTFVTQTNHQAEELNNIVGSAFRMAYVAQLQQKPGSTLVIPTNDSGSIKSSNSSSTASSSGNQSKNNSSSSSSNNSWARQSHDKVLQQLHVRTNCKTNTNSCNSSEEDNVSTMSPTEMNQFRCWPSKPEPTKFLLTTEEDDTSKNTRSSKGSRSCSPSKTRTTACSPCNEEPCCNIEEEEVSLKHAPWFQAGIPREIALEILNKEPIGSFLVRQSTSKPGCFALSLRVPKDFSATGISHYLILRTNRGYKIKGFTKEFPSLSSLIIHHSVMPELLPCPLLLSRYCTNPGFQHSDVNDFADIDSDPDYSTLSSFRKKMADLNI